MERSGDDSWRVVIEDSAWLIHAALYVRDPCGLAPPHDPGAPPALTDEIADHVAVLSAESRGRAGVQWLSWWKEILRLEGAFALDTLRFSVALDRLGEMSAVRRRLLDWPALEALVSWPDLREAVRASYDNATAWLADRSRQLGRVQPRMRGLANVSLDQIVANTCERSRLPAKQLRAAIFVLSVEGSWSALAAPGVLLCSSACKDDPQQMAPLIETALRTGASATDVHLQHEEEPPGPLPVSVIGAPLVLLEGSDWSLTCERVIPYGDGFEVELRARGLLSDGGSRVTASSRRGFERFGDLQVTVCFSDGRSQRVEAPSANDVEEAITISPFLRRGSSDDTLWLWVMPLPPEGPVKLSVTWPSKGIEEVGVELAGGEVRPH